MDKKFLKSAADHFCLTADVKDFKRIDAGHINDTFFVECEGDHPGYIMQRVNTSIFQDPEELMENIVGVCNHVRAKVIAEGKDPDRYARTLVPVKEGGYYFIDNDGGYWRVFISVKDVISYNKADTADLFYKSGCAFGHFFNQLADYPAETLHEVIPDFHNTVKRFGNLKAAADEDVKGRRDEVKAELDFAYAREDKCSFILDGLADGRFNLCVTHNDTKLNNILMDKDTGEGVCIIDLDTVMPGSILYDFGDSIRFGASSAAEDEADLDKVYMQLDMFEAYVKGFVGELKESLTKDEILALPMGAYLMTYEVGIRFLTDYLQGDTYFQTSYDKHNLVRARNQLKLVADMEEKMPQMMEIVKKYI